MVILINGASCTGKTYLAQNLMEKYKIPYLSIDHIKIGLIRSKNTNLTPYDDEELQPYLWNIIKEIIKTVIENNQNIIIEGAYIPFNYKNDFSAEYLDNIKYICLAMSEKYINNNYNLIINKSNIVENRSKSFSIDKDFLISENKKYIENSIKYNLPLQVIDNKYVINVDLGNI